MKRLFVITTVLGLLTASEISLANSTNQLPQATTWYGVTKTTGPYTGISFQSVRFYLQGDTVINDTVYKAFYRDGIYCAGLRQTTNGQQVYIRPTAELMRDYWEQGEHLLYNFDVQPGDIVYAFDGSYAGIDDMGVDMSVQYRWTVQKVQTIEGRKHVTVVGGQLHSHQVEWIEGIGTRYVLFENVYEDALWRTYSSYALCVADSEGNTLYSFNTDDIGIRNNCPAWEVITSALELSNNQPAASKILRDGQILIFRDGKTFTLMGQRVE